MAKFTMRKFKATVGNSDRFLHYDWCLWLETLEDLYHYVEAISPTNQGNIMRNASLLLNDKEPENKLAKFHQKSGYSFLETMSKQIDAYEQKHEKMRELILEGYTVIVKPNGSWMLKAGKTIIQRTVHSNNLIWPQKQDIDVFRYTGGTHWYVNVGGVKLAEKHSFKTKAYQAAIDYIENSKLTEVMI